MIKKSVMGFVTLFSLLLLFSFSVSAAMPLCYNERSGASYEDLTTAVSEALDNDTIVIAEDITVSSTITVNKSLSFRGKNGTETVFRDTSRNTGSLFYADYSGDTLIKLSFSDITLDGGADWDLKTADAVSARDRVDRNKPATSALIRFFGNVELDLNKGTLIENCNTFRPSSLSYAYDGGAVYCEQRYKKAPVIRIYDGATIRNCSVGGRVYSEAGAISSISYNESLRNTFEMTGGIIEGCAALDNDDNTGGALFLASCSSVIDGNSVIRGNYTFNFGAGISQRGGTMEIGGNTVISDNIADDSGGAFLLYTSAQCSIGGNASVVRNSADSGGACFISSNVFNPNTTPSSLLLKDSAMIADNTASSYGGGIVYYNCSVGEIGADVEICGNTAPFGGGIFATDYDQLKYLKIEGSIYQNTASQAGADIYAQTTSVDKLTLPIAGAMDKEYIAADQTRYRITDWFYDNLGNRFDPVSNVTSVYPEDGMGQDLALVAAGKKVFDYAVTYQWNGSIPPSVQLPVDNKTYPWHSNPVLDTNYVKDMKIPGEKDGIRGNFVFSGWSLSAAGGLIDAGIESDIVFEGMWTFTPGGNDDNPPMPDDLDTENHFGYIIGLPDGTIGPNREITRAEVATIFFRLLKDDVRSEYWMTKNPYKDVKSDQWFNNAISTLTNLGILHGYTDGTFRPTAAITRAEFVTMAVRFFDTESLKDGKDVFTDISRNWARKEINRGYQLDIIHGYPDGTFRPDLKISRAEAMQIVNNTLRRNPRVQGLLPERQMITWPDNRDKKVWYYTVIQEATNSHEYSFDEEKYEVWTKILPLRDWAALEKQWSSPRSSR